MKGITFENYHSYDDFQLILSQKTIGTPSPKINQVEIEGGDGVLDLTEFFGETKYNNRNLSFDFSTAVQQEQFMNLFSQVQDALHGQKMRIILDDDAGFYYYGRITVSEWKTDKNIGKLTIDCECDPYKYKLNETVVSKTVSGSDTIVLTNSRKRVVPLITTDAQFTLSFGTYTGTFSAGTFRIPELELIEGNNTVNVSGTGNISFTYQEGGL